MQHPFGDVQFERKPSGVLIVDGMEVGHTLQCCHCQAHFISIRGSGKRRGFCSHCNRPTCGKGKCDVCIPFEEKLALMEGKPLNKSKYKDNALLISPNGDTLI